YSSSDSSTAHGSSCLVMAIAPSRATRSSMRPKPFLASLADTRGAASRSVRRLRMRASAGIAVSPGRAPILPALANLARPANSVPTPRISLACGMIIRAHPLRQSMTHWLDRLDATIARLLGWGAWLALPVVTLLFLQWPLRDLVHGYSREANDLG